LFIDIQWKLTKPRLQVFFFLGIFSLIDDRYRK